MLTVTGPVALVPPQVDAKPEGMHAVSAAGKCAFVRRSDPETVFQWRHCTRGRFVRLPFQFRSLQSKLRQSRGKSREEGRLAGR
jgi:hypothetical protein